MPIVRLSKTAIKKRNSDNVNVAAGCWLLRSSAEQATFVIGLRMSQGFGNTQHLIPSVPLEQPRLRAVGEYFLILPKNLAKIGIFR
jgi:hypothetical protein